MILVFDSVTGFLRPKSSHRYSCFVGINRYLITEPGSVFPEVPKEKRPSFIQCVMLICDHVVVGPGEIFSFVSVGFLLSVRRCRCET